MIFVLHFCKNKQCNNGELDEDILRSKKPPTWKYCKECVSNGYVNPEKPPVRPHMSSIIKSRWAKKNAQDDVVSSHPQGINRGHKSRVLKKKMECSGQHL